MTEDMNADDMNLKFETVHIINQEKAIMTDSEIISELVW